MMSLAVFPLLVEACVSVSPPGPDVASSIPTATATGTSFPLGGHSDEGVASQVAVGGVASRFTVTSRDAVPPSLVAVQVSVVPAVSASIVRGAQPALTIDPGDSRSATSHVTVTLSVYQP